MKNIYHIKPNELIDIFWENAVKMVEEYKKRKTSLSRKKAINTRRWNDIEQVIEETKQETQELKRNIYSKEFEKFRLEFPHARQWKKNETYEYFKQQDKQLIHIRLNHLKRCIRAWLQDPKYIQASQRRVRDITPIDDTVMNEQLKKIMKRHLETEWAKERYPSLAELYGADKLKVIAKAINSSLDLNKKNVQI